jgi:hypothetical protein
MSAAAYRIFFAGRENFREKFSEFFFIIWPLEIFLKKKFVGVWGNFFDEWPGLRQNLLTKIFHFVIKIIIRDKK